jgi:hypothetical protein
MFWFALVTAAVMFVIAGSLLYGLPLLAPLFVLWLLCGISLTVLYHVARYVLEPGFVRGREDVLSVIADFLRALLFILFWPILLLFDRTPLRYIRLFVLYLVPSQREQNDEIKDLLRQRGLYREARNRIIAQERRERERLAKTFSGEEKRGRTRTEYLGQPELERYWLLVGLGAGPDGSQVLVRLYPDCHTLAEVRGLASTEAGLRRPARCRVCGAEVAAAQASLPEPAYLCVLDPVSGEAVVDGWAMVGEYRIEYGKCAGCGETVERTTGDVREFGSANEVAAAVRAGMQFRRD